MDNARPSPRPPIARVAVAGAVDVDILAIGVDFIRVNQRKARQFDQAQKVLIAVVGCARTSEDDLRHSLLPVDTTPPSFAGRRVVPSWRASLTPAPPGARPVHVSAGRRACPYPTGCPRYSQRSRQSSVPDGGCSHSGLYL